MCGCVGVQGKSYFDRLIFHGVRVDTHWLTLGWYKVDVKYLWFSSLC